MAIRPAGRHYDYRVDGRTVGAYAQLRWSFAPGWRAGAALRLERTEYEYDNRMLAGNTSESGVPCAFGGCLFSRPADRDDSFDNASPRLELDFAPAAGQRIYVSAGRGFRPLIGQALLAGVPVLTAVNPVNLAGFLQFADGLATPLPTQQQALLDWCRDHGGARAA